MSLYAVDQKRIAIMGCRTRPHDTGDAARSLGSTRCRFAGGFCETKSYCRLGTRGVPGTG